MWPSNYIYYKFRVLYERKILARIHTHTHHRQLHHLHTQNSMDYTPIPVFPCCLNLSSVNAVSSSGDDIKHLAYSISPGPKYSFPQPEACGLLTEAFLKYFFPSTEGRPLTQDCVPSPGNWFSISPSQRYLWEANLQVDSEGPSRLQRDPLNFLGVLQAPLFPRLVLSPSSPPPHLHSHPVLFLSVLWINLLSASLWFRICFPGYLT